jgi:hypothetical protein
VWGAARAGRREGELTEARLRERDHVGDGSRRQQRGDRHDQGQLGKKDDRRKILHRIVWQVRIKVRADAVGRDRVEQQGVAVGIRFGDAGGCGRSTGAAAVHDDDGLPERVGELRPTIRATKSAAPPGGTVTTSWIGRLG